MDRKKWIGGLLVVLLGALIYQIATNVSHSDIAEKSGLPHELHFEKRNPGDIVALDSRLDPSLEPVCSIPIDTSMLKEEPVDRFYYNSLVTILPGFGDMGLSLASGAGGALMTVANDNGEAEEVPGIHFMGVSRSLANINRSSLGSNCNCEMALRLMRGERLCTVKLALTSADGDWQAIRLTTRSNVVPKREFERCNAEYDATIEYNETAAAAYDNPPDCGSYRLRDWDIKLRSSFRLIKSRTTMVAANGS